MSTDTRERIVGASAELFRRQGYVATGVKQIAADAGAPFGSLYHFFPGGKEQLGAEVIRSSGALYGLLLPAVMENAPDLITAVGQFFTLAAQHLQESDYADACPIATVALEVSSSSETLREACSEVFQDWIDSGVAQFVNAGLDAEQARELTLMMLCLLEGAFIFSRAMRSTDTLVMAGSVAQRAVSRALREPSQAPASSPRHI